MTKQRVARRGGHRGVRIVRLLDGQHVARWRDPLSGKQAQQALERVGATNDATRRSWCRDKAAALAEIRRAISVGAVSSERLTVRAAVDDYLKQQVNAGTEENKRIVLDAFEEWTADQRVRSMADLKAPLLMRWRDHLLSPTRCAHATSTRNRWLVATGIFLRWASKRGLVPLLSWDTIRHGCERVPEPVEAIDFLRPLAVRKLLEAALAHDATPRVTWKVAPFVLLLLLTGCRFDELAQLRWDEVDLEAGAIRLPASRTKTKRAREITFREAPTIGALLQRMRPANAAGNVFRIPQHSSWEAARRRLVHKHKAPEFTAHALRRTAGTVLTNASGIYGGASAWHSAKRLGHSVEMAERAYAGLLSGLPATATTIEQAIGIEDLCARIAKGD